MNPLRRLSHLGLLALLAGCAVQNAASGEGDEDVATVVEGEDAAVATDDVQTPGFDVPTVDPDAGATDPDTGPVAVDPDVGTAPLDAGPMTRPDVVSSRDVSVPPADRGGATDGGCSAQSSCAACTALPTCGWCGATAGCHDGTSSGPLGASCASGWAWTAPACTAPPRDPCALHTQCGTCTDDLRCGWCRSTRRCMTGVSTGPTPTPSACTSWAYVNSACITPGDSCATAGGCGRCTGRSSCGWCEDSDTCHSGSSSGPTDGACRGSTWRWQNFFGLCL